MFHSNLKNRRLFCELSQQQVADFLNVTPQSISKWEKGAALPSIEYLPKLAEILDCDVNSFFVQNTEKNETLTVLSRFFDVMKVVLEDQEKIYAAIEFIKENPSTYEIFKDFTDKLSQHRTVSTRTIQEMFSCSEKDAMDLIQHLVDHEMIERVEDTNSYRVEECAGVGFRALIVSYQIITEIEDGKRGQLNREHELLKNRK